MKSINSFLYNEFVFSSRYRVWRHLTYWAFHLLAWGLFWQINDSFGWNYGLQIINLIVWIPAFILFSYPMVYWGIPQLLLKERVIEFILLLILWAAIGLYINYAYRNYIYLPVLKVIHFPFTPPGGSQPASYLCMAISCTSPVIIKFFKLWTIKQRDLLKSKEEKAIAELELLRKQIHPHFLFNTLNNIYSFSLSNSPQTPGLILKLSSLLNYMLYDCKTDEVELEKEIEVMKNYVDLEKERYGNAIALYWNVKGKLKGKKISPLLMLPFLENAFKHGISEQFEKPFLKVDISVDDNVLRCEVKNSKNSFNSHRNSGIGINNVQNRLAFIYPGMHELTIKDEGDFFTVVMQVELKADRKQTYLPVTEVLRINEAVSA